MARTRWPPGPVTPRPLAQARQIRPAAPVGAENLGPGRQVDLKTAQRRRPIRRSGRDPGPDPTPAPAETTQARPEAEKQDQKHYPHPPCRFGARDETAIRGRRCAHRSSGPAGSSQIRELEGNCKPACWPASRRALERNGPVATMAIVSPGDIRANGTGPRARGKYQVSAPTSGGGPHAGERHRHRRRFLLLLARCATPKLFPQSLQ